MKKCELVFISFVSVYQVFLCAITSRQKSQEQWGATSSLAGVSSCPQRPQFLPYLTERLLHAHQGLHNLRMESCEHTVGTSIHPHGATLV